jgi:hypothetical protein
MTAAEQYQAGLNTTRHEATAANTSYDHAREVAHLWRDDARFRLARVAMPPEFIRALDALAESFPEPNQEQT